MPYTAFHFKLVLADKRINPRSSRRRSLANDFFFFQSIELRNIYTRYKIEIEIFDIVGCACAGERDDGGVKKGKIEGRIRMTGN